MEWKTVWCGGGRGRGRGEAEPPVEKKNTRGENAEGGKAEEDRGGERSVQGFLMDQRWKREEGIRQAMKRPASQRQDGQQEQSS